MGEQPRPIAGSESGSEWMAQIRQKNTKETLNPPNYFVQTPEVLHTKSKVHAFMVGDGASIFEQLQSSIESAEKEVILITCFWAPSPSLDLLVRSLKTLSEKVQNSGSNKRVRVFIGLSSLSITQKLFQTSALRGKLYGSKDRTKKLGLPSLSELPGLDVTVKSIFVRPFSVMHPKFVIIDRKIVWLPSCNVSWESWFEGATILSGPVVQNFVHFWEDFWLISSLNYQSEEIDGSEPEEAVNLASRSPDVSTLVIKAFDVGTEVETFFLPSPHHANPQFRPFFFQKAPTPPATPLNLFLLQHIRQAKSYIYLQSPNLTSPPVLAELIAALSRDVDVQIVTSQSLMVLEQLGTAGTTTKRCVGKLIGRYVKMKQSTQPNLELGNSKLGELKIDYFKPRDLKIQKQPVQSHIKFTLIDDEIVVLGSQNMDRASWYTNQELGVAFKSKRLAKDMKDTLQTAMAGRTKQRYDSLFRHTLDEWLH